MPHLCKYMPEYREGRKLIADPDHEPDLATIGSLWPVPTESNAQTVTTSDGSNRPSSANSEEKLSGTSDGGGLASAPGRRESSNDQSDDSDKKIAARATATRFIQSVSGSSSQPQQPLHQSSAGSIAFPPSQSQATNDAMSSYLNQLVQQAGQQALGHQQLPTSQSSAIFSLLRQYQPPAASVGPLTSLLQLQGREKQQFQNQSMASLLNLSQRQQQQPPPQLQAPQQAVASLTQQIASMVANAPTEQQQQELIMLITELLNQNQGSQQQNRQHSSG